MAHPLGLDEGHGPGLWRLAEEPRSAGLGVRRRAAGIGLHIAAVLQDASEPYENLFSEDPALTSGQQVPSAPFRVQG